MAVGAALAGLNPVVEFMTFNFGNDPTMGSMKMVLMSSNSYAGY